MAEGLAVASLVIGAASTAYSIDQRQDAQDKREEARERRAQMRAAENAKERRKTIARQRVQRARAINNAATSGALEGSGVQGTTSALAAQTGGNIGFQEGLQNLNQQRIGLLESAQELEGDAAVAQQVGGLAMQGASFAASNPSVFDGGTGGGTGSSIEGNVVPQAPNPTSSTALLNYRTRARQSRTLSFTNNIGVERIR